MEIKLRAVCYPLQSVLSSFCFPVTIWTSLKFFQYVSFSTPYISYYIASLAHHSQYRSNKKSQYGKRPVGGGKGWNPTNSDKGGWCTFKGLNPVEWYLLACLNLKWPLLELSRYLLGCYAERNDELSSRFGRCWGRKCFQTTLTKQNWGTF